MRRARQVRAGRWETRKRCAVGSQHERRGIQRQTPQAANSRESRDSMAGWVGTEDKERTVGFASMRICVLCGPVCVWKSVFLFSSSLSRRGFSEGKAGGHKGGRRIGKKRERRRKVEEVETPLAREDFGLCVPGAA